MSPVHLHLVLTHVPVLGTPFALALLAFAIWRRSEQLKKVALSAFIIVALLTVPAYLTGEPSEHVAESLPGVSESIMEQHEDAGLIAMIAMGLLGAAALGGLAIFRGPRIIPAWYGLLLVAGAVAVSGIMAWTANLGGQVRHTEIRTSTATAPQTQQDDDD